MPLKKLPFKPGVNREGTRYSTEGGWFDCDKVRFREGLPEKIGGWVRATTNMYLGVCRSLLAWNQLAGGRLRGVGTHLKYYVEQNGAFFDITPLRATTSAGDVTFSATNGSSAITVTDTAHGAVGGDFVTFSGAVTLGGNITADVLNQEYQIDSITSDDVYVITALDTDSVEVTANASDTGNGGASVVGAYQENTGAEISTPLTGWGAGGWGLGAWGTGESSTTTLRVWSHANFGEDLIYGPQNGNLYYWDSSVGTGSRGVALSTVAGASDTPTVHRHVLVTPTRFVMVFGANEIGSSTQDPMLIRWSAQESAGNFTPAATNQAGSLRLSSGSAIVAVLQARQEILVWTDTTLYSLQYVGVGSGVWGAQVVGENISILNGRSPAYASGVAYWMGDNTFYAYDGRVQPLMCDLRKYVFNNFNTDQYLQMFSGTVEQFQEVWWFYCSGSSDTVDRYVVFNYGSGIWYFGTLARTAWDDNSWEGNPLAATYSNKLLVHETGIDDNESATPAAINAYIESSQFDLDDGHRFAFVWRVVPDVSFSGSTTSAPQVTLSLKPLTGSGSGYTAPASVGGEAEGIVTRTVSAPVEVYTDVLNLRCRGRQMALRIESDAIGVQWQLGASRIDFRPDGRA